MHRQMINSTLIYFGMIALQALTQIILLPFQTHYLSPSQYGVLATVIACATLLSPLFNLGLHGATQRFAADYQQRPLEQGVLWSTLIVMCLLSGLLVGLLLWVGLLTLPTQWLPSGITARYLGAVIAHALGLGIVLMASEFLRMVHQPLRYALASSIMLLSYVMMNGLFIGLLQWKLQGALLAFAIMPWIGCLAFIATNIGYWRWKIDLSLAKPLLSYAIKALPHFSFIAINAVADRLLLMIILGRHFTGIYTAGTTLASTMLMITSAIAFAARPQIFAKFSENTPAALEAVAKLSIIGTLVIAYAGANLALWSPEIVKLLTSTAYHSAWQIALLLILKYMLQGISVFVLCSILYNKVKVQRLLFIAIGSLATLIFFSTQLIPHYGLWGVAIAGLMATLFELFFNYRLANNAFTMVWPIKQMLMIIIGFFTMACAVVILTQALNQPFWLTAITKIAFTFTSLHTTLYIIYRYYKINIPQIYLFYKDRDKPWGQL